MYRYSAGIVAASGKRLWFHPGGVEFHSSRTVGDNKYELTFVDSLGPSIILVASSQGGKKGAWMHVLEASSKTAFLIASDYAKHGNATTEFHFYALGSVLA